MNKRIIVLSAMLLLGMILGACTIPSLGDSGLESTRVALAIQQTSLAMEQTRVAQNSVVESAPVKLEPANPTATTGSPLLQPTYTPYPTYTMQAAQEQATDIPPTQEPVPAQSFEDWLEDVKILLYDDMFGRGEPLIIESAIDGLGLGPNTTNDKDAMGNFLSNMNSGVQWDLIIIGAESRDSISGEYFDVLADQIDRGSSVIIEIWYIDDIASGKIQPVMQRCGIAFHRDWYRKRNANLNEYLVYLLKQDDPIFSEPNTISMLIPYDILWIEDVGDLVKINPGSDAVLLAGAQPKEYNSYGLMAECLDGRMVWQLFSTHDYKYQDMINMWQNYIHNTLKARYEYLNP